MNINKNYLIFLVMPIKNIINQNPCKNAAGKGAEHFMKMKGSKNQSTTQVCRINLVSPLSPMYASLLQEQLNPINQALFPIS